MAAAEGGPMYCLMSALSTKATSILSVMLDVVRITTLECLWAEGRPSQPGPQGPNHPCSDTRSVRTDQHQGPGVQPASHPVPTPTRSSEALLLALCLPLAPARSSRLQQRRPPCSCSASSWPMDSSHGPLLDCSLPPSLR